MCICRQVDADVFGRGTVWCCEPPPPNTVLYSICSHFIWPRKSLIVVCNALENNIQSAATLAPAHHSPRSASHAKNQPPARAQCDRTNTYPLVHAGRRRPMLRVLASQLAGAPAATAAAAAACGQLLPQLQSALGGGSSTISQHQQRRSFNFVPYVSCGGCCATGLCRHHCSSQQAGIQCDRREKRVRVQTFRPPISSISSSLLARTLLINQITHATALTSRR